MSKFIENLKSEHRKLFKLLELCKKGQGIVGGEWKNDLFSAKNLFIGHLKKEDNSLYPELLKAAEKDTGLKKKTDKFIEDMKSISKKALAFFNQYTSVSAGTEFVRDYAEVEILLKSRMKQEEENLFPEYEKLH